MEHRPLTIRGHHLLCILGFRGYGYSDAFVKNMQQVVDAIEGDAETLLLLVSECDCICRACPYEEDGVCTKSADAHERIEEKDRAVLTHIGCAPRSVLPAGVVYRRIADCVEPYDLERTFCSRCEWLDKGLCVEGLSDLKNKMLRGT
jgi:hypothetical protein